MKIINLILLSVYALGWIYTASFLASKGWHAAKIRDGSRRRLDDIKRIQTRINAMKGELQKILEYEKHTTIQ